MVEEQVLTLGTFMEVVLLGDMRRMIMDCHLHYLGFGVVASGIEFLGACMDEHPLGEPGHSKTRFNAGLASFDEPYHAYANDGEHSLYTNLRCGMAHIVRPQGDVVFTHLEESILEGTTHLELAVGTNKLVLVSEQLYADFALATARLAEHMADDEHPKHLADPYLVVPA